MGNYISFYIVKCFLNFDNHFHCVYEYKICIEVYLNFIYK